MNPGQFGSSTPNVPAVTASNTAARGSGIVSTGHTGVSGESKDFVGVLGLSHDPNNAGVMGVNDKGGWGVTGRSSTNTGVSGESETGVGVHGKSGNLAGLFDGPVKVNGSLFVDGKITISAGGDLILQGGDCAENFDICGAAVVPGTVLVIGAAGGLEPCEQAYDRKVAGVVSGAGSLRPGILLDTRERKEGRQPVAFVGKVYCQVDADWSPIQVGDLLTTSPRRGHAMKAVDERRAFGALLGKALESLPSGRGLIPVLVALQ